MQTLKTVTRADIVREAKTWIGTPFKHQGRIKGVGVDCAGVVIGIAHALAISDFNYTHYSHVPDGVTLRRLLEEHLIPKFMSALQPGDIVLMCFDAQPQHVGILSEDGIIHAYAQVRRCCEHRLDAVWRSRMVSGYAYPGLQE